MHKKTWLFLVVIFVFVLSACGGGEAPAPAPAEEAPAVEEAEPVEEVASPTEAPVEVEEEAPPAVVESEFPLPDDVESVTDLGNGSITFSTSFSLPDAVSFYRFAFIDLGYTEREINTSITETVFSMVFDGHESGKAIVIQGLILGDNVQITLRYEDM